MSEGGKTAGRRREELRNPKVSELRKEKKTERETRREGEMEK